MPEHVTASVLRTQIERIVKFDSAPWRRTKYAEIQRPGGWFICTAWFEDGEPRIQIRSNAHSLEEAAIVATGIQMAIDWLVEETARGGNVPRAKLEAPNAGE
jgi:hypothetical protein